MAALDKPLDDLIKDKKKVAAPKAKPKAAAGKGGAKGGKGAKGSKGGKEKGGTAKTARKAVQPYILTVVNEKAGGGGGGAKAKKGSGGAQKQRGGGSSSILNRLGGKADDASKGTKVLVANLVHDITDSDVKELFSTVGEVLSAKVKYDRSGRSTGTATVFFAQQSKAIKAAKDFNNRTLDGKPMQVKVAPPGKGGAAGGNGSNGGGGFEAFSGASGKAAMPQGGRTSVGGWRSQPP